MRTEKKKSWHHLRNATTLLALGLSSHIGYTADVFDPPPLDWEDAPTEGSLLPPPDIQLDCTVKVLQNGQVVTPAKVAWGVQSYELSYGRLRIETPDARCKPSVARLLDPKEWMFLGAAKEVVSLPGYAMADVYMDERPLDKVPFTSVAVQPEQMAIHTQAASEYQLRCKEERVCPPLLAIRRTYWPFLTPEDLSSRAWADFTVAPKKTPDGKPSVTIQPVAVYTNARSAIGSSAGLNYLQATVMIMKFSERH